VLQDASLLGIDVCLKARAFISVNDPHLIAMITQAETNLYVHAKKFYTHDILWIGEWMVLEVNSTHNN
jgi:hypothetical protein